MSTALPSTSTRSRRSMRSGSEMRSSPVWHKRKTVPTTGWSASTAATPRLHATANGHAGACRGGS
eukprot:8285122-Lingulodinium_polyedra.AAC.1